MLHASDEEEALAFDLMEEFRAPVVEAASLSLIARKGLTQEHFVVTDERGLRLTRDGWARGIRAYEAWAARPIRDPLAGDTVLWRGLFDRQALRLADCFENGSAYTPYAMDY